MAVLERFRLGGVTLVLFVAFVIAFVAFSIARFASSFVGFSCIGGLLQGGFERFVLSL